MEYSNISNNSFYGTYTGSYEYQTKQFHLSNKEDGSEGVHRNERDSLTITEEAKKAICESKTQMLDTSKVKNETGISKLGYSLAFEKALSEMGANDSRSDSSAGYAPDKVAELKKHFGAEEGSCTDTFSRHLNKMTVLYQMMSGNIEEKYADPNREAEYYRAEDGSWQELTKEKEQEMLDDAYQNHSKMMAGYTENLNALTNANVYEVYSNGHGQAIENTNKKSQEVLQIVSAKKGEIQNAAYQAFMSAISGSNITKLMGTEGSWNHVKLDLGISSSQVNDLNKIWNYYADRKQ